MKYIKIYVPHVWQTTTDLLKTSKKEIKPEESNKGEQKTISHLSVILKMRKWN